MGREHSADGELISALVDGELTVPEFATVIESVAGTQDGVAKWRSYHLVGEMLRGSGDAPALDGGHFVERLRGRLEEQKAASLVPGNAPAVPQPLEYGWQRQGANDPLVRWKLLAGAASLAAVVTIGWHVGTSNVGPGAMARIAVEPLLPVAGLLPGTEPNSSSGAAPAVMLRDARLDELLAAHKQFGGTSALQMPAGFLRNATFDGPGR